MEHINRTEVEKRIDILEDDIAKIDPVILDILLQDKTTNKNILWCTKDYESYGPDYDEHSEIKVELITDSFSRVIQPRAAKAKAIREQRIKKRAEVFTPSWVCNEQNNQVDDAWFNKKNVFNTPKGKSWNTKKSPISFESCGKDWKSYVESKRLEVTCGEAPYLVSRYDTTTGRLIPVEKRIGVFDRKMRIVNENCSDDKTWVEWSIKALQSVYGYEFQGDSVLIARENLLYDYMDYYYARFHVSPTLKLLKQVADIIAWNIWQMDGLRLVVPYSCHDIEIIDAQISLFELSGEKRKMMPCPGCEKNDIHLHTGMYCRVLDWADNNNCIRFIELLKEAQNE